MASTTILPFQSSSCLATFWWAEKGTARKIISAPAASRTDRAETLGPSSFVKDESVSGPRELAMATAMFLWAKARASAAPMSPEPMMACFIRMTKHPRLPRTREIP